MYKCTGLAMDGDLPQVNVCTGDLAEETEENGSNLIFGKYSAQCSYWQSPNDNGNGHKILKGFVSNSKFIYDPSPLDPHGALWAALKVKLGQLMTPASYKTVWKLLAHVPDIVDKAFTSHAIKSSFSRCGLIPFNPKAVLCTHPDYKDIPQDKADYIVEECLPELYDLFNRQGIVYEEQFDAILDRVPELDKSPPKLTGKPLNDCHTSRQRCCIMNSDGWREHLLKNATSTSSTTSPPTTASGVTDSITKLSQRCRCFNPACHATRSTRSGDGWAKCQMMGCRMWSCPLAACIAILQTHQSDIKSHLKK